MLLYSKPIIKFIEKVKSLIKSIISNECHLKVFKDRFYDVHERYSYPIKPVVFTQKKVLGYFDPSFFEIGIHETLMHQDPEKLMIVLRHEIAHFLTHIFYGENVKPHGDEFKSICKKYDWPDEVLKATLCLEDPSTIIIEDENSILRKVKKLLALGSSSNCHEAEQAMIKAQEMLLKHHLNEDFIDLDDKRVVLKRVMKQKRRDAKMRAVALILETFLVNSVYTKCSHFHYLEIVGERLNVEIAEHIVHVLERQLEELYKIEKSKDALIRGKTAKNSFFLGVATGYCQKVEYLKKDHQKLLSNELISLEKKLIEMRDLVYPKLHFFKSRTKYCQKAKDLGQKAGNNLTLHQAVKESRKNAFILPF